MLDKILVYIAAGVAILWAVITSLGRKQERKEYEDTLEVSKKINTDQRTGNVRDRMRKYIRKDS